MKPFAMASAKPTPLVSPEQISVMERETLALRLLDAANELRVCFDAIGGIEADGSSDQASREGLRSIVGRQMNALADIAVEIDPGLAAQDVAGSAQGANERPGHG